MTKSEELKLLEQIEGLILSAGADSYIGDTFAGVVEICRNNIVNDFGDFPVYDLDMERKRRADDNRIHGENLLKVEHERDCLADSLKAKDAEIEKLGHLLDSKVAECENWEQNAHDAGEMYCRLEEEIKAKDAEIIRLKAEIYDLRNDIDKLIPWCEADGIDTKALLRRESRK